MKILKKFTGNLKYWVFVSLIAGILVSCIASAASVTVTAPTTITRGGVVNEGVDEVTGSFYANITGSDGVGSSGYVIGLITNPQNMTGGFCDRPPWINETSSSLEVYSKNNFEFDVGQVRTIGNTALADYHGASIYQLVPNGEIYPANDPGIVYLNGTRYYSEVSLSDDNGLGYIPVLINTTYNNYTVVNPGYEMSVKPGTYIFHATDLSGNDDPANYPITITYGTIKASITQLYQSVFQITGINTDSNRTYFWITGEDLPECGRNLEFSYEPSESGSSSVYTFFDVNTKSNYYYTNGTFSFPWTIPPTIKSGNYTLWVSSVDPATLPLDKGTWKNTKGVCGLQCDICAPKNSVDFTIGTWGMDDPVLDNSSIVLDCCNHSVCTTCLNYPKLMLKGDLNIEGTPSGYPLQIWIFGNNMVGDRNLIFNNSFRTYPDDQSSYEIDLMRILLDQGITVCDLENGEYQVIVQAQGVRNGIGNPMFDITHERSIADVPVFDLNRWFIAAAHPYSKYPVSAVSGWYPLFAVEGQDSVSGYKAFRMITDALDQDYVRDDYRVVNFTVSNVMCGGVAGFTATPLDGNLPLTVQFTDASSYTGSSFNWTFGDGSVSTERNVSHVYTKAGYYDVTFTVWNGDVSKIVTKNAYIYVKDNSGGTSSDSQLVANFTALNYQGAAPLTTQFMDLSTGSPVAWIWNFGDGDASSEQSPLHTYKKAGSYTVALEIYNKTQNSASTTKVGFVDAASSTVRASFRYSFPDSSNPVKIQFTDLSTGSGLSSWNWTFGDGTTSTVRNPVHEYAAKGCYIVSLKTSNSVTSDIRSYQLCI